MKEQASILVADQQELVAKGLHELFEQTDQAEITAYAKSGQDVLEFLAAKQVDIILMDISLPNRDGIDTMREIAKLYPNQHVLGHSILNEIEYINSMLIEGAKGYILKGASLEEYLEAFATIAKGKQYLSPTAQQQVQAGYTYTDKNMDGEYVGLKSREREVITCIAKEMTNKEIADQLCISIETVRTHRKNLMTKLDVKSAAGLVKYAVDRRWI